MSKDYAAKSLDIHGLKRPLTIYAYGDLNRLFSTYSEVTGRSPDRTRIAWSGGQNVALAGIDHIFLNTSGDWYKGTTDTLRAKVSNHEMFHIYQIYADRGSLAGPKWLNEGSAELFAYLALVDSGVLTSDEAFSVLTNDANNVVKKLDTMESRADLNATPYSHQLSALAINFLTKETGIGGIINYYGSLGIGLDWQDKFNQAFGVTLEEFYPRFEAHRVAGFQTE